MNDMVKFTREKNYVLKKELGQGGLGKTVLLFDEVIEEHFACKKYSPIDVEGAEKEQYFKSFVQEIKLLHLCSHPNIVRIFNHHLYPEKTLGYILMEYVEGSNVAEYLREKPEDINSIFEQVINGFTYLEDSNILHRDIRPNNILITKEGVVKIIDFGFGKSTLVPDAFKKTISINWAYETPEEFKEGLYNHTTEIYFIAKLFHEIILQEQISDFKYNDILSRMLPKSQENRAESFAAIKSQMSQLEFEEVIFSYWEGHDYRQFASSLSDSIQGIEESTRYISDIDLIELKLAKLHSNTMLESNILNIRNLINCFLSGSYSLHTETYMSVETLKKFEPVNKIV